MLRLPLYTLVGVYTATSLITPLNSDLVENRWTCDLWHFLLDVVSVIGFGPLIAAALWGLHVLKPPAGCQLPVGVVLC